jgi:hypothetical protein
MKTFELLLADETDEVYAISLVEKGAIEKDFVWFGKEDIKFATADDEKRIVAGPLLIPEKKIIRVDGKGETYFVYFTAETIEKIAQRYMLRNYNSKATLEHDKPIEDVTLVESWVSKSRTADKASTYGFNLPAGTWYGLMKINNDDIWNNYVKSGVVNAFSIEGSFEHKQVSMTIQEDTFISQLEEEDGVEMLGMIKRILKKDNRYKSKEKVEMESWSDYPDSVSNNAKRGIELNDKLGNKCATPVGKIRAQQLANKRPLSVETISRMYSYLSRAEAYYDENDMNACGTISFYLWGGLAGKRWAESKLKELGKIEMSAVDLETAVSVASSYPGTFETSGSVNMEVSEGEINILGYHTKNFKLCPGATTLFEHLQTMPMDEDTIGMVRSAAQIADNVFAVEKSVLETKTTTQHQYEEAVILVDDFKDLMAEIDEEVGMMHDVSFMDGHITTIKSYMPTELEIEEGDVNPCQSGYIMIGFKDKDGRQVPNCVPEK